MERFERDERVDGETITDEVVLACAEHVVLLGAACGATVSTAESCTAGMVASEIASVSGASDVLRGGAVTYVNEIKERVLGVDHDTLERWSAVSHQTAREMALGSRRLFGSDAAVSVTGYAGPTGGTEEDPVGTVCFGCADAHGCSTFRRSFSGDRAQVRRGATWFALKLLASSLQEAGESS